MKEDDDDEIPSPPLRSLGPDPTVSNVKERHKIALENAKKEHLERIQQIKNDPSRRLEMADDKGVKDKWKEAQAIAYQIELDRYQSTRKQTLSQFQPIQSGHVKGLSAFFHRLIIMAAPTLWSINRTITRGLKRLEELSAGNRNNSDMEKKDKSESFQLGSTAVYRFNMVGPEAERAFRDAMAVNHGGRPQVLVCGVWPSSDTNSTTVAEDDIHHHDSPLNMTAVAILSDEGHVYIAVTITVKKGQQDEVGVYGLKKIAIFSEDGTIPLLEKLLDVVPALDQSSSAHDHEEEFDDETELMGTMKMDEKHAFGTDVPMNRNNTSARLTGPSIVPMLKLGKDLGLGEDDEIWGDDMISTQPQQQVPPPQTQLPPQAGKGLGQGLSQFIEYHLESDDDGDDTEDEDASSNGTQPICNDEEEEDEDSVPATFLSAVGTMSSNQQGQGLGKETASSSQGKVETCTVRYSSLMQFSTSVISSPARKGRTQSPQRSPQAPRHLQEHAQPVDEIEHTQEQGLGLSELPDASSRRIRVLRVSDVVGVSSTTRCLVLRRGGDVSDAVVFTGELKSALTSHPTVTDTKLLVVGDSMFEWSRGAAASGWMYKWPLRSQQSGRRTRRYFVLRNNAMFYFKDEPMARFPRSHLSFRSETRGKKSLVLRNKTTVDTNISSAVNNNTSHTKNDHSNNNNKSSVSTGFSRPPLTRQQSIRQLPLYQDDNTNSSNHNDSTKTNESTTMAALNKQGLMITRDSTVGWGVRFLVPCIQLDTPFDTLWMSSKEVVTREDFARPTSVSSTRQDGRNAGASNNSSGAQGRGLQEEGLLLDEDEGELSYRANDGRLALRPPKNHWIREMSRAIALDRQIVDDEGHIRQARHPLLMTNIDKLVNITWNHEDSKDFNCVAVDAIDVNTPMPIRQKLSPAQPPQSPPNPLPVLLYQHVALFCLRTCTPCSSPDSAVATSGRIDNLFLLQEKNGGDRNGGGQSGSTSSAANGDGVALQWYNINNTYSITMETRYQQPSSSSSSSSGSPISSKTKSSTGRNTRGGGSSKGNSSGSGLGSTSTHGADDLLKESLKIVNERGTTNINSELSCVALCHLGYDNNHTSASCFTACASVLNDAASCCVILAGSHGYVSVGVPRMRPVVRPKINANASNKATADVFVDTSKRHDSHHEENGKEEEEEEVVLVCLTPPPILEEGDLSNDGGISKAGGQIGMVDPECATDDSDNDEDDVRRVDEHRATRATVGRGHSYETNVTCVDVANKHRRTHHNHKTTTMHPSPPVEHQNQGKSLSAVLFATGDDQSGVSLWRVTSAPAASEGLDDTTTTGVSLHLLAVLKVANLTNKPSRNDQGQGLGKEAGSQIGNERIMSLQFLPNESFLLIATNKRLLLVLLGDRQQLSEMHWHGTNDVDTTSSATPTATSQNPTHKPHQDNGLDDDNTMSENVMMSVWDSSHSHGDSYATWSFLSWVELDRVPPGCEGIFSMALDETINGDHDGNDTPTHEHANKIEGLPSSSSVVGSGQQHKQQLPSSSSSSTAVHRSIALWKIVVDTEPRPISDHTATLSNNPLNVDFENTMSGFLSSHNLLPRPPRFSRASFSSLLSGTKGGINNVSDASHTKDVTTEKDKGMVSSFFSAISSSMSSFSTTTTRPSLPPQPPLSSSISSKRVVMGNSTTPSSSSSSSSSARLASRGGFRGHVDDGMAISLDLGRLSSHLHHPHHDDHDPYMDKNNDKEENMPGDDEGDEDNDDDDHDDDIDCRVFRFAWTDAMFDAAIQQLKVIKYHT